MIDLSVLCLFDCDLQKKAADILLAVPIMYGLLVLLRCSGKGCWDALMMEQRWWLLLLLSLLCCCVYGTYVVSTESIDRSIDPLIGPRVRTPCFREVSWFGAVNSLESIWRAF